jgi:hypothetical protein
MKPRPNGTTKSGASVALAVSRETRTVVGRSPTSGPIRNFGRSPLQARRGATRRRTGKSSEPFLVVSSAITETTSVSPF